MKILFYGTKNYDEQFFEKLLPEFPDIKIKFIEANIHEETASLAKGYEAICAFVNADLGAPVIEELHQQGVKLILMRCAGYNNVDLKIAHKYGMKVPRLLQSTQWRWRLQLTVTLTRLTSNAVRTTLL